MRLDSPIAQMIRVTGEPATISTPTAKSSANYDPTSTDASPVGGGPNAVSVRGMIADKKTLMSLPQGCETAFTIEAYSKPTGLTAGVSKLKWPLDADFEYVIHSYRERRYLGILDGYTLYLSR